MAAPTITTKVAKYMTRSPLRIDETTTIAQAMKIMQKAKIRHLPVTRDRKLVGLVSTKDIALLLSKQGADPNVLTVSEAMKADPYYVLEDAVLCDVIGHMVKHKMNCTVIIDSQQLVVGIFTVVDALRILHNVCLETSKYMLDAA